MHKEFAVTPPGRMALVGIWLPTAIAIAVVIGTAVAQSQQTSPRALLMTLPFLVLISLGIAWAARRRRIVLDNRELEITAALYRKRISVEALDLERARVLNLEEHTELRPAVKTNGFNLPGFAAGHYRMRNLSKAFCLVTDRTQVLALPQRDGPMILLSAEKPRALLDELRELATPGYRR